MVTDVAVDVVLSSIGMMGSSTMQKPAAAREIYANMIISVWNMESEKYFTLTFTQQNHNPSVSTTQPSSRPVTKTHRSQHSPNSVASNSSSSGRISYHSAQRTSTSSSTPSPSTHSPLFPPQGPPSITRSNISSAPSVLQKATRLRDAMLNMIGVPAYGMWKDDTVGLANEQMLKLAQDPEAKEKLNQRDFLKHYTLYTEDYERRLDLDEYPIMVLCREQKRFEKFMVCMPNPKTKEPRVFDVTGEPILDEHTGDFLGGVVIFRDVSEYLDRIKVLNARNADQLSLIAQCIPHMVWVTQPNGDHEWFSQKWYDYTGLTEDQSVGKQWANPFHPDDMPATSVRWEHSLRTGQEYNTEYRCRRRDGQWRWHLGRALPLRDNDGTIVKWFGTCTDVHEAVVAREQARRYRENLLQVLDTAQVTLLSVDTQRRISVIDGNLDSLKRADGTTTQIQQFVGQDLNALFEHYAGGPLPQQSMDAVQAVLDGKSRESTTEFQSQLTERWYRLRFLPLSKVTRNGGIEGESYVEGAVGVCVDTTELRDREHDLKKQEEENSKLAANALAAKEASRMKSQFLAYVMRSI